MSRAIKKIVVHHSVTPRDLELHKSISSFDSNHKKRLHKTKNGFWYHISYHFVIWWDWKYIPTRPLDEVWYHASNLKVNKESVGICLTWNFDVEKPSEAQYATLNWIIKNLEEIYGDLEIHEHNEFAKKSCPGKNFILEKILMWFYEKLRNDNYSSIKEDDRIFKSPDGFLKRTKDLTIEEKLSEMTYLIAILSEKLWKKVS